MSTHHFLLSIKQETLLGMAELKKTIDLLKKPFSIQKTSSFYKRYFTEKNEDLNSEILLVIRASCEETPSGLQKKLEQILAQLTKTEFILLTYDQLVLLSPELPLPNPELAMDPALLRCASEVWGDYEHPILGQSLNEIVKSVHSFERIEFFAQGETLL